MRRLALFALTLFPLVPGAVQAQTAASAPSAAQAKLLEQQLQQWLQDTIGPDIKLNTRMIRFTPAGDHYALTAPMGKGPNAPLWTADAKPGPGGRWSINNVRIPSPATFTVDLPDKAMENAPPGTSKQMTYTMTIGQQAAQMLLDPTFATPTTTTSTMQNVDIALQGGLGGQKTHIGSGASSFIVQPASDGRANVLLETTLDNYSAEAPVPGGGGSIGLGASHVRVTANMDSVSREHGLQLIHAVGKLISVIPSGSAPPTADQASAAKAGLDMMLEALTDLASAFAFDEKLDNFTVNFGGMQGSLRAFQIGFGAKQNDSTFDVRLDLGAEGLTLPELGLGAKADLIPSKVMLRPRVTGIPTQALTALLDKAKAGGEPGPEEIMALFAGGGIGAGLESLIIDVAGAEITGQAKVSILSPTDISGTAQITATNLDLLQQRISADPELAPGGAAVIFLKGIGRMADNRMIWDVSYKGGHLLVNNQDMTALAGGGDSSQDTPPDDPTDTTPADPQPPRQQGQGQLRHHP